MSKGVAISNELRAAAQRALGEEMAVGEVVRLTLEVKVGDKSELVAISLEGGQLKCTSTGGDPFVHAAIAWLANLGATVEPSPPTTGGDMKSAVRAVVSVEPPPEAREEEPTARARLADAVEDVVTSMVRAGLEHPDSPSVTESLARLRKEAPLPTPLGLARWLGRIHECMEKGDHRQATRLLYGASRLAADLRAPKPGPKARRRVVGWLGATGELGTVERISDRTLFEVSRYSVPTSERGGIERRHLVDLRNGEIFREERSRSHSAVSVGPSPRVIQVGLAEVSLGPAPRHIRLMQYVVNPSPPPDALARLKATAYRRFQALADRYREWLSAHPGQAEPFAVVAPARWSGDEVPVAYDDEGQALPFARADDPAAVELLRKVTPPTGPSWVAGRLVDAEGGLLMVPTGVAVGSGKLTRFIRLR